MGPRMVTPSPAHHVLVLITERTACCPKFYEDASKAGALASLERKRGENKLPVGIRLSDMHCLRIRVR